VFSGGQTEGPETTPWEAFVIRHRHQSNAEEWARYRSRDERMADVLAAAAASRSR
jgi:hypothetical protein